MERESILTPAVGWVDAWAFIANDPSDMRREYYSFYGYDEPEGEE